MNSDYASFEYYDTTYNTYLNYFGQQSASETSCLFITNQNDDLINPNFQDNIVIRPSANLILDVGVYSNTSNAITQVIGTIGKIIIAPNLGNVGIGILNPSSKLHVVGNTTISGTLTSGLINNINIENLDASNNVNTSNIASNTTNISTINTKLTNISYASQITTLSGDITIGSSYLNKLNINSSIKLTTGVLYNYASNWIYCYPDALISIIHDLSLDILNYPPRFKMLFSDSSNPFVGSNNIIDITNQGMHFSSDGYTINHTDGNEIKIKFAHLRVCSGLNISNTFIQYTAGYFNFFIYK